MQELQTIDISIRYEEEEFSLNRPLVSLQVAMFVFMCVSGSVPSVGHSQIK